MAGPAGAALRRARGAAQGDAVERPARADAGLAARPRGDCVAVRHRLPGCASARALGRPGLAGAHPRRELIGRLGCPPTPGPRSPGRCASAGRPPLPAGLRTRRGGQGHSGSAGSRTTRWRARRCSGCHPGSACTFASPSRTDGRARSPAPPAARRTRRRGGAAALRRARGRTQALMEDPKEEEPDTDFQALGLEELGYPVKRPPPKRARHPPPKRARHPPPKRARGAGSLGRAPAALRRERRRLCPTHAFSGYATRTPVTASRIAFHRDPGSRFPNPKAPSTAPGRAKSPLH